MSLPFEHVAAQEKVLRIILDVFRRKYKKVPKDLREDLYRASKHYLFPVLLKELYKKTGK
jgi:hypothetical protein